MTKTLLKKQMLEVFAWVYQDKKTGKNRSKSGMLLYVGIYLIIFGFLGYIFYEVADMLAPLIGIGFGWMFMALLSLIGVALGVFGSVFNTYASLYQAKDNDMLLAMPVSASVILITRLAGVYALGLMYEIIVMIPTLIVFFMHSKVGVAGVLFTLLIPFVLSVLVLALSCIIGWLVAVISSKVKNKNIITVILSLGFIAAYYYVYGKAYGILQQIMAAPEMAAKKVKSILYPFYHMGLASQGDGGSMLVFTAIVMGLFGIIYLVLSRSFIKIATTNHGAAKVKYQEKEVKAKSVNGALFQKEIRRFLGSPTYMLNCGLGIVMMLIAAVAMLFKGDDVLKTLNVAFGARDGVIPMLACAALCAIASTNDLTAPSVSLEGKNLWIVQAFPVSGWQVLMAKLNMHLVLTLIPALLLTVSVLWILKPETAFLIMIPMVVVLFILFMALIGLILNLKMPNLTWTNEAIPVKQSMGVMIALFGGWMLVVAFGGIYYLFIDVFCPVIYMICVAVLLLAASMAGIIWLRKRGARIFETL